VFKFNEDAFTLDDMKVVAAIASIAKANVASLYEKAGMIGEAEACRRFAAHIQAKTKASVVPAGSVETKEIEQFGSVLARLATVPTGHVASGTILKEGRWAEFAVIEQAGVLIMIMALTVALAGSWVVAARWGGVRRKLQVKTSAAETPANDNPVWLLFSRRQTMYLLAAALGVPMAIYYAYSRWTPIAGREFSPGYIPIRFMLEMLLMAVTVLGCYSLLGGKSIRKRCSELNIPAPAQIGRRYTIAFWCLVVLSWGLCLTIRQKPARPIHRYVPAVLCMIVFVLLLARQGYLFVRALLASKTYGRFYGTAARSAVIFCGLAILVLSLVVYPALTRQEGRFLERQRRFAVNAGGNLANVEFAHVVAMKNAVACLRGLGE
jgi:hypothetical protein